MQISRRLACSAALAALLLSVGAASAQEGGKLKLGTEGAYPPFNTLTADGKLAGFDIDVGNALCAQMKVECEWVTQDWDGIIPALQGGKFDAIIASMTITEERKQQVDFTDKYYTTPLALVALKDTTLTSPDKYAKAGADVKLYPTQDEAMADLTNGRLDAVVSDKFVLVDWMKTTGNDCCKLVGDLKGTESLTGIAVRKGDPLREKLNAAIAAIVADGTYAKINAKYFDFDIYGKD